MRPQAGLRQSPIFFAGDVDPQPAAETLEDELGLHPGGEGNYRDPPQTRDEAQMLARFAPKAPVGVRFWGRFWRRWGGVFASRAPRSAFSPVAHPREHPVVHPREHPVAHPREHLVAHWGDVDLHPAETPEDELGLRPGGEGNYRGPLQTRDEVQSAMPARFAPKAPAAGCFWGRFRARFGSLVARRWVRLIVSPAAHRREYPVVFRGEELLPLPPV